MTRTPLSRSKGRRSTCRGGGILWRPSTQLVICRCNVINCNLHRYSACIFLLRIRALWLLFLLGHRRELWQRRVVIIVERRQNRAVSRFTEYGRRCHAVADCRDIWRASVDRDNSSAASESAVTATDGSGPEESWRRAAAIACRGAVPPIWQRRVVAVTGTAREKERRCPCWWSRF